MGNECWSTPLDIFKPLDDEFGFDLDVCAEVWNAKCEKFYTPQEDGLKQEWLGTCWMNPPYGKIIELWIRKAFFSSMLGATVVCLVPSRTETSWWHEYCLKGEIRYCRGRIWFTNRDGKKGRPRFASALVIFRPNQISHPTSKILRGLS